MTSATNSHAVSALEVAQRPVATVYARGLLAAGEKAGQSDRVLEELSSLVDDVLPAVRGLDVLLSSQFVDAEQKELVLDKALAGKASPLVLDSLKVLARHERLDHLRTIRDVFRELLNEARGRIRVQVRSAVPLDEVTRGRLLAHLTGMVRGQPSLEETIDPELLGGLVVRVGDVVYDGSLATQLEQVRSQILERSVHEIQSRRDRFSHPA